MVATQTSSLSSTRLQQLYRIAQLPAMVDVGGVDRVCGDITCAHTMRSFREPDFIGGGLIKDTA